MKSLGTRSLKRPAKIVATAFGTLSVLTGAAFAQAGGTAYSGNHVADLHTSATGAIGDLLSFIGTAATYVIVAAGLYAGLKALKAFLGTKSTQSATN